MKWKCEKCIGKPCMLEIDVYDPPIVYPVNCRNDAKREKVQIETPSPEQKPENTLPDWCKVGEWVYIPEIQEYIRIAKMVEDFLFDECGEHVHHSSCKQARLRPWTFEEAPLFLKVKDKDDREKLASMSGKGCQWYYFVFSKEGVVVDVNFKNFAELYTHLDGTPCGVLEHLEDGEWKA